MEISGTYIHKIGMESRAIISMTNTYGIDELNPINVKNQETLHKMGVSFIKGGRKQYIFCHKKCKGIFRLN